MTNIKATSKPHQKSQTATGIVRILIRIKVLTTEIQ